MHKHYKRARFLTTLLDQQFTLFGFKFGLDPLLGLIIGSGDIVTLVIGLYYVWIAKKMNASYRDISRMIFNVTLDMTVGFIPVIGDIFDFAFKSHVMNMRILEKYESELDYLESSLN